MYQTEFFGRELLAICNYSGGLLSWKAAQLAVKKFGRDHTVLLYADTGNEAADNYRFIVQGAALLGEYRCTLFAPFLTGLEASLSRPMT